jgi:hypothetical protein
MSQPKFNGRFTGPRFVLKFTNGTWIIFDRLRWEACEAVSRRVDGEKLLKG